MVFRGGGAFCAGAFDTPYTTLDGWRGNAQPLRLLSPWPPETGADMECIVSYIAFGNQLNRDSDHGFAMGVLCPGFA